MGVVKEAVALLVGLLFGFGLILGGMTQPAVVLGFLDLFGAWNPRLLFVMAAAVATTALGYRLLLRRNGPWLDSSFHLPAAKSADRRLVLGAALFGIGWGVAGYCPGPALVSIGGGEPSVLVLAGTMALGYWLASRLPARRS